MRETCARVLAAALMTGAIAFVLAMPALFESAREVGQGLTAPPSSLRRSVHVLALPAPSPARAERLAAAHPARRPASRPAVVRTSTAPSAVPTPRPQPRPASTGRSPAPTTPPQQTPQPETRVLAAAESEPSAELAAQASSSLAPVTAETGPGKSNGKAKGHDKVKGLEKVEPAATEPAPAVAPSAPPSPTEPQCEADPSAGHGPGKGHGYGHED